MFPILHRHNAFPHVVVGSSLIFISLLVVGCGNGSSNSAPPPSVAATGTPGAETAVGERLFLDTRFAQSFKVFLDNSPNPNVNDPNAGDSVVDTVETVGAPIVNEAPFKGMSMNCRSCHFVDDVLTAPGGGMRTYADFARRSPIPARADGKTHTARNSPALVNSTLARPGGVLFHFDAEFNSMEDLVAATLTGRNFGWLPGEQAQAIAHIARVVKGDDGSFDLTDQFGGLSYRIIFTGGNPAIPDELRLPPEFRAFIESGTDQEVFNAVVKVIAAYVNGLLFSQTEDSGAPIRSPFDVFLEINGLPQQPDPNETPLDYSRRLLQLVTARELAGTPQFMTTNPNRADGQFQFHPENFLFTADELTGLKMFLTEPSSPPTATAGEISLGKIGNCLAYHVAPNFTDFKLHNTGVAQREFDDPAVGVGHAAGSFMALSIPKLAGRTDNDLPATEQHPSASERFRSIPTAGTTLTDLGIWNIFANPDMSSPLVSNPQAKIRAILCDDQVPCPLSDATLLDRTIARFKTPRIRDLGRSAPYMHNGKFDTLE
ncbi:MAG TPA: hypothetical protein VLL94_05825, partial [Nitrospiraceae bacterium]|nr:hypothetical protein [Nitrospiraceae bacterium]